MKMFQRVLNKNVSWQTMRDDVLVRCGIDESRIMEFKLYRRFECDGLIHRKGASIVLHGIKRACNIRFISWLGNSHFVDDYDHWPPTYRVPIEGWLVEHCRRDFYSVRQSLRWLKVIRSSRFELEDIKWEMRRKCNSAIGRVEWCAIRRRVQRD